MIFTIIMSDGLGPYQTLLGNILKIEAGEKSLEFQLA